MGYASNINAYCVGKVRAEKLELFKAEGASTEYFQEYLDKQGKSIFDNYEILYKPGQDYKDYHLEKYQH